VLLAVCIVAIILAIIVANFFVAIVVVEEEEEPVLWFTTAELGEYWSSRPAVFDKQTVAYLQAKLR